jgi:3-phenylpropionate/trans-cinnamate dioxygenase ferredoxin reductase component
VVPDSRLMEESVVIVGAGHAGEALAVQLRQLGYAGAVTLLGGESERPYQRPPLSKALLKGEATAASLALRAPGHYAAQGIDWQAGARVTAVDVARRQLQLGDGRRLSYGHLVLATGVAPRPLRVPGSTLPGIHLLRELQQAEALRASLCSTRHLAVVGAGFIGLEVAAVARGLGIEVTVVEAAPGALARVASKTLSDAMLARHHAEGVQFRLGGQVTAFEGDTRVTGLRLASGARIPIDGALVCIGGEADLRLVDGTGIADATGIPVDAGGRTRDPHISAIGDITLRPVAGADGLRRLESVQNALEQARQVAARLTGNPPPAPEVPWNWSDQYDLKLQFAGLPDGVEHDVVRGDPAGASFAVFRLQGKRLRAVEAVNAPQAFMVARQLIARAAPVDAAALLDPATAMKDLLA